MEIEVGEFVRTNDGLIGKLIRIERDDIDTSLKWYVFYDNKNERYINKPYIVNHGKNIIDLIEYGDVLEISFPLKRKTGKIFVDEYFKDSMTLNAIIHKNIILKSILTKEQFQANEYRIGE